jgi:hypothetical protein
MKLVVVLALLGATSAFSPAALSRGSVTRTAASNTAKTAAASTTALHDATAFDQEQFIQESKDMRLKHLEDQAKFALKIAVENYGNAVFPNAMIAGDGTCLPQSQLHETNSHRFFLKAFQLKVLTYHLSLSWHV